MRDIGPIDPTEVNVFQEKHGASKDGKVGRQTWGEVIRVDRERDAFEAELSTAKDKIAELLARPPEEVERIVRVPEPRYYGPPFIISTAIALVFLAFLVV